MKANELMIGDWVRCGKRYMKVTQLTEDMDCDDIGPVPLTSEILEKNGWIYIADDNVFYPENLKGELPWIYYITDGSNEVFRMKDFCNLQYVHQLQHALRLCEIEKEIIL